MPSFNEHWTEWDIDQWREEFYDHRGKIRVLLTSLIKANSAQARDIKAREFKQFMESEEFPYIKQGMEKLEDIVENEQASVSLQIAALEAITEHTLPNYWIVVL